MDTGKASGPVKVLHVVGVMRPGGIETWLLNLVRLIDVQVVQFDFLVESAADNLYADELRNHGSHLVGCPNLRNPLDLARAIRWANSEYGPYDAIHSHVYHYSGVVMFISRLLGIPVRISHSHNDYSQTVDANPNLLRRLYIKLMNALVRKFATRRLATSGIAGSAIFGKSWGENGAGHVLHCGIALDAFEMSFEQPHPKLKTALGIPAGSYVLGHIGRFVEAKNHDFLLRVFRELSTRHENVHLLLVGSGPLEPRVVETVNSFGITSNVTMIKDRSDIPDILTHVVDQLLLPSKNEGLGMVLVEAQAAGVPSIASSSVPREAGVVDGLITFLDLNCDAWISHIESNMNRTNRIDRQSALEQIKASSFNIEVSLAELMKVYKRIE